MGQIFSTLTVVIGLLLLLLCTIIDRVVIWCFCFQTLICYSFAKIRHEIIQLK